MVKRITAGFRYLFNGTVDSSGFMIGNTAAGATAGAQAGEGMARLEGAQVFPANIPENENVVVLGDDEAMTSFDFSAPTLPAGVIELAVRNNIFEALIQGTKVQTEGDLSIGILQPGDQAFVDMSLLGLRRSKKWIAGVQGVKAWENVFMPRATITPLFSDYQTRQNLPYRYSYTTSRSDRKSWGATFTELQNGTLSAPAFVVDSDNPLHLMAFTGDNAQQAFDLEFTPVSSARMHVFDEGVKQALTTDWTVAGKTITFVGTPASNARMNVLYEVAEADLS